jgi:hypothetical protein
MAGTTSTRTLFSNLEKILIGLIFTSLILFYIATGNIELRSSYAYALVLLLEILLAAYYLYVIRNKYSLFLIGFIILNIAYLLPFLYGVSTNGIYLLLVGKITYFCLGLFLIYKTVKESLHNKDLELFGTLISIALLFPLFHHFYFSGNEDYLMVYHFALAFMLGTVIYNENLWDKYTASEKKILTYVLVCTVVEVLLISVKLL